VAAALAGVGVFAIPELLRIAELRSIASWVPVGVVAGLLVRWGVRRGALVFAGALSAALAMGNAPLPALLAALTGVSGPLALAAWLARRDGAPLRLDARGAALRFGLATVTAMALPPALVLGALQVLEWTSGPWRPASQWVHWWAHASIVTLLLVPAVATLTGERLRGWCREGRAVATLLGVLLGLVAATLLLPRAATVPWVGPLGLIAVLYAGMRMDLAFTSLFGLAIVTAITINVADDGPSWSYGLTLAATVLLVHALLGARQRAEDALQAATLRHRLALLEAASSEQQRIGRDVHDTLGQELAALSLLARAFETRAGAQQPALAALARDARLGCDRVAQAVRGLARGLLEDVTDLRELVRALERLAGPPLESVTLTVDATRAPGLPADTCANLFRIAEEAFSRARQRLGATRIGIVIGAARQPGWVRLDLTSDGRAPAGGEGAAGPDPWQRTMLYRAEVGGGRMAFGQSVEGGMHVACELPIGAVPAPTPAAAAAAP
jgi:signal transduction histidine kinase